MTEMKTCFVISPIGDQGTEIRKRSDTVLKYIITPAVEENGFQPIRADHISEPGIITSQVIQHIIDDPLVIADLTGHNPNVFYELAVRHAIRKPLIQICSKDETIPFDVAPLRTIELDHRDLESVENAKQEISRQINSVMSDPSKVDSPISMSLDLQMLKQSDELNQRSLADIIEALSVINLGVKNIQTELATETILKNSSYYFTETIELSRRLSASINAAYEQLTQTSRKLSEEENNSQTKLIRDEITYAVLELRQALELTHSQIDAIRKLEKAVTR